MTPPNPETGTPGGNDTVDKLFLLSYQEADEYFKDWKDRIAKDQDGKAFLWWLRTPGYYDYNVVEVWEDGGIDPNGAFACCASSFGESYEDGFGVRPAMWWNTAEEVAPLETSPYEAAGVGEIIKFGGIDWRVLELDGEMVFLLSEYLLEKKKMMETSDPVTWETADLRAYLNGDFLSSQFSEDERKWIEETLVETADDRESGTPGGNPTRDRIFLLSLEEVEQYLPEKEDRIAGPVDGKADAWWLRTPGSRDYKSIYVWPSGATGDRFSTHDQNYTRPALWLNTGEKQD